MCLITHVTGAAPAPACAPLERAARRALSAPRRRRHRRRCRPCTAPALQRPRCGCGSAGLACWLPKVTSAGALTEGRRRGGPAGGGWGVVGRRRSADPVAHRPPKQQPELPRSTAATQFLHHATPPPAAHPLWHPKPGHTGPQSRLTAGAASAWRRPIHVNVHSTRLPTASTAAVAQNEPPDHGVPLGNGGCARWGGNNGAGDHGSSWRAAARGAPAAAAAHQRGAASGWPLLGPPARRQRALPGRLGSPGLGPGRR